MADPSKNLEDAIDEYYKNWPLGRYEDIRKGQTVRPSIMAEIWTRLSIYRTCKLIGPPRSGKTYTAFSLGLEVTSGIMTQPFKKVRYLDLATVKGANHIDDILGEMDERWLFIIDNCHLATSCHGRLVNLLQTELKRVGLLLIETKFLAENAPDLAELSGLSLLMEIREIEGNPPVDVGICLEETARSMLEQHLRRTFGLPAECQGAKLIEKIQAMGGHLSEKTYQSALRVSMGFKAMKSNLRFLSWRLQAWKPVECNLWELSPHEVLTTVRQMIVYPCQEHIGTLEQIAALAQWELPYSRPAGTNPPEGIVTLMEKNIIASKGATAWQMDPTDAHLIMLANFGKEWEKESLALIRDYLSLFPEQTADAIHNIEHQARAETSTSIVSGLLQVSELMNAQKVRVTELVQEGKISFNELTRLAACLLRRLNKDPIGIERRRQLLGELLSDEMLSMLGQAGRNASLVSVMWFVVTIRHIGANASKVSKLFFDGFGTRSLTEALSKSSFAVAATILKLLRTDQDRFIDVVSKLPMRTMGERARNVKPTSIAWFLTSLNKLGTEARTTKELFFDGYGTENLIEALNSCNSFGTCANVLKHLRTDQDRFGAVVPKLSMTIMGERASGTSLLSLLFFLRDIKTLGAGSDELIKSFLDGYGRDNLVSKFRASDSWHTRDKILQEIRMADPLLSKQLRSLHQSPTLCQLSIGELKYELRLGCAEAGDRRRSKIHLLEEIDELYLLDSLKDDPEPAVLLDWLLYAALWLDQEQAKRLASVIPGIWASLSLAGNTGRLRATKDTALRLGFMLRNCWLADHKAGKELLDVLQATPLHSQIPLQRATGIGIYLRAMEIVADGILPRLCSEETDYLFQICEASSPKELDELLIVLATLAPSVIRNMIELQEERSQKILITHASNVNCWIRYAVRNLCGIPIFNWPLPDIAKPEDILTCGAAQAIAVIYGVQTCYGGKLVCELLNRLSTFPETSTWIPLLIGRARMPMKPDYVSRMIRAILLSAREPRVDNLDFLVVAMTALGSVAWPMTVRPDPGKLNHCALETAIHEGVLNLKIDNITATLTATLNMKHAFVKTVREITHGLIEPIRPLYLTLHDWDMALSRIEEERADHYRSKLLATGLVTWKVEQESGQPIIIFGSVNNPDISRVRGMIALSA